MERSIVRARLGNVRTRFRFHEENRLRVMLGPERVPIRRPVIEDSVIETPSQARAPSVAIPALSRAWAGRPNSSEVRTSVEGGKAVRIASTRHSLRTPPPARIRLEGWADPNRRLADEMQSWSAMPIAWQIVASPSAGVPAARTRATASSRCSSPSPPLRSS